MSVLCQKEKCKEFHFIHTMNMLKQNQQLKNEISKLCGKKWTLEQDYKKLKKNYNKLRKAHEKLKKMAVQKDI